MKYNNFYLQADQVVELFGQQHEIVINQPKVSQQVEVLQTLQLHNGIEDGSLDVVRKQVFVGTVRLPFVTQRQILQVGRKRNYFANKCVKILMAL